LSPSTLYPLSLHDALPIFLMALMIGVFVLGFFFDWLEICLIVLPIFGPILIAADFSAFDVAQQQILIWCAILVAINMQTSFLTPDRKSTRLNSSHVKISYA